MGAFALAVGSLLVGLSTLVGMVIYVGAAASRVEQHGPYAGDHGSNTHEHRNRTQRLRGRGRR